MGLRPSLAVGRMMSLRSGPLQHGSLCQQSKLVYKAMESARKSKGTGFGDLSMEILLYSIS